jgi:hypothetical protein
MAQNDQALLTRLKACGLDFVVIGGVCAVYHGCPIATFDLDICCPFGEENVKKIESALAGQHPFHRLTANKLPLEMTKASFGDLKNIYLQSDIGILDCLGEVAGVGDFASVLKQSVKASLSYGEYKFLSLDGLIAAKAAAAREKDMAALRQLRCIKEKKSRHKDML